MITSPRSSEVQTWPIDKLIFHARNSHRNDAAVDRMCGSIRELGFKIPVLARSDGVVVDSHLRLKAARKLNITEVPVILCDEWTPAQVKAFRLMVNRSVTWADWDEELLSLELQELNAADFDLDLTGFNETINGLSSQGPSPFVQNGGTLTLGDGNATATFSGTIRDNGGSLSITKIGTGVQTFTGANTYSGATTVSNGTLVVSTAQFGATGGITVNDGPTLGVRRQLCQPDPVVGPGRGALHLHRAVDDRHQHPSLAGLAGAGARS